MGATYTRQSSFTDGDVISAADSNDEFDQLLATFQASSGHTHDGTANEGGAITKMLGAALTLGDGSSGADIAVTFDGESNDGVLTWMEDEDHFKFSDDILIIDNEQLIFGSDSNVAISYDETTTDSLKIAATEGAGLAITLMADEGDDAGDEWKLNIADGGTLTLGNDIASAGTYVTHLTLTPNSTVASSTLAVAGNLSASAGTITYGSLSDGSITVTAFVDEDNMSTNSATLIPTQQSVKAYVDSQVTAQDLDAATDSGTIDIDLDSETLTVAGGEGIDTSASGTTITIAAEEASTSNKGVASFSDTFFAVSSGVVSLDVAQTGITSLLATAIKIGEDDQTKIDFETADTINFYAGNEKQLILTDGALTPGADNILDLGSSGVEFKDGYFDGTVTADAFAGPLTGNVTGNTSGSSGSTTGNAATATALATARTIGGTSFDGTANIAVGLAATATALASARTIGGVSFDGTGNINLPGVNTSGNQDTSGNAATATALATARTIGGTSFDGTGNISVALATLATTVTITDNASTNEDNAIIFTAGGDVDGGNIGLESDGTLTYNPSTGKVTATGFIGALTGAVTGNVAGNLTGTVSTATQNSITTATGLVSVGALDSGSITSGFGNIDNGASNITSGGLVKLDVDSDADDVSGDSATGRLTMGAGEDLNLYHGGTNSYIVNDTGELVVHSAGGINFTTDTATFTSVNSTDPVVIIKNTTNDTAAGRLHFVKDKGAAGADGDDIGTIEFISDDSGQAQTSFAKIVAEVSESANTDEAGKLSFFVAESDGTTTALTAGLVLEGEHATDGEVDVTIAAGTASTTTVAGSLVVTTDLDVDGTANLDVVDIDGAVDMASTLTVGTNLTITNGNLIIGTSGKGIDFSATGDGTGGGSISELLADYEKGTFTATLTGTGGSAGSVAGNTATWTYIKIGNFIHINGSVTPSNMGSYSGTTQITGIPFAAGPNHGFGIGITFHNFNSRNDASANIKAKLNAGSAVLAFTKPDTTAVNWSETGTGYIGIGGGYQDFG